MGKFQCECSEYFEQWQNCTIIRQYRISQKWVFKAECDMWDHERREFENKWENSRIEDRQLIEKSKKLQGVLTEKLTNFIFYFTKPMLYKIITLFLNFTFSIVLNTKHK